MPNFRQIKNGFVAYEVNDADLYTILRNLKQFVRSGYDDTRTRLNPLLIQEIIKQTRLLAGTDFRAFLLANYNRGIGPQSNLVRCIVRYMNGDAGYRALSTAITIEENKIRSYDDEQSWHLKNINQKHMSPERLTQLDNITGFDFFRLAAGTGPELMARLFLVIGGVTYDGK